MDNDCIKVAVMSKKSGGKSTLSLNLAVAAAKNGMIPIIIDVDQQANLAKWRARRENDDIAVVAAPQSLIKSTIKTACENGANFIIVDCPGHNDSAAVEAARETDLALIPVKPQIFHLETLPAMRDVVRIAGDKPTWVVINEINPVAHVHAEKLKKIISENYSFSVCPTHLSRLEIFATSADMGLSVIEQEPKGRAAKEVKNIFKFICKEANEIYSLGKEAA